MWPMIKLTKKQNGCIALLKILPWLSDNLSYMKMYSVYHDEGFWEEKSASRPKECEKVFRIVIKIRLDIRRKFFLPREWWCTVTGCTERLWIPHLVVGDPAHCRGVETKWSSTQDVLWFCDYLFCIKMVNKTWAHFLVLVFGILSFLFSFSSLLFK